MVGNKAQKAVAAALTGMLALGSVAPALAASAVGDSNWIRLDGSYDTKWSISGTSVSGSKGVDGADRYDTMLDAFAFTVEDLKDTDWADTDEVVLASGTSYADALSANGFAGAIGAPIVITPADKLGSQAEKVIEYLAKDKDVTVYIVGGEAAVSADVEAAVDDLDDDYDVDVERIGGEDRLATSLKVTSYIRDIRNLGVNEDDYKTIFIANGWAWADALSVSSIAYLYSSPILLTNADGTLSDEQVEYIKDEIDEGVNVYAIGGPAAAAYDQIKDIKSGNVRWIYGDNRYDTSAKVAKEFEGLEWNNITVATGKNWPDALVGGAFAGNQTGILVLVGEPGEKDWSAAVKEVNYAMTGTGYIMGGEKAISKATAKAISKLDIDVAKSGLAE